MSKQLITADTIRQLKANKQTQLEINIATCIITPEAREVAEQLDIKIIDQSACPAKGPSAKTNVQVSTVNNNDLTAIRQAIMAQLPKDVSFSEALIDQLVTKAIQEQKNTPTVNTNTNVSKSDIKVAKGDSIKLSVFEGAGKEKNVGIADAITAADNSSMAAGYMQWENAFFPWTLTYDEIITVLVGELHIRHKGETKIAKAGDVMFIPKGSAIEFGTPTNVRLVYVAWPANWQEQ